MKAFGDAVGFGEAPHADDGLVPVRECLRESDEGSKAARLESGDEVEQLRDQLASLAGIDVFVSHELGSALHLFVDGLESRILREEALEGELLAGEELARMGA